MKRPLLSIKEARARLACGDTLMRKLIRTGQLPAARICGLWRIDPDDLDRFVEAQKAKVRGAVAPAVVEEPFGDVEQLFT